MGSEEDILVRDGASGSLIKKRGVSIRVRISFN